MKNTILFVLFCLLTPQIKGLEPMKYKELSDEESAVIVHKGTEAPFSGQFYQFKAKGTYICRRCLTPLYWSEDKFDSRCGWPSFDGEIPGAVHRVPDADGIRTEILCAHCNAHLGHVFTGEHLTDKNIRHCVNSISLLFVPLKLQPGQIVQEAIFAGGCFWGVEYYFQKAAGVLSTQVGYTGGNTSFPDYKSVCSGKTGHAEAIQIFFDPKVTTYEKLCRLFFEIHDPTQDNRQGPDIGDQYRSEVFYLNAQQKTTAEQLIRILRKNGYDVKTKITPAREFWIAEDYHQDYYQHKGTLPYCHARVKRF